MSSRPYPYHDTTTSARQTQVQITKMLYEEGCEATRWTEEDKGTRVMLEFIWKIPTDEGKKSFAFRVSPPVMKKWVGRGNARHQEPNPNASMRLLWWYLKSKLEAVKYGLVRVEEEFLQAMVLPLPGGRDATMGEVVMPQIKVEKVLGIREWVALLPSGEEEDDK